VNGGHQKSNEQNLVVEAQWLYDSIENNGGFSSRYVLVLESIRNELQRRDYTERLTITFEN
jgi:hypothetical protein